VSPLEALETAITLLEDLVEGGRSVGEIRKSARALLPDLQEAEVELRNPDPRP
jgi:hypothetical protein